MSKEKFSRFSLDESICFQALKDQEADAERELKRLALQQEDDAKAPAAAAALDRARERLARIREERALVGQLAADAEGQRKIALLDDYRRLYESFRNGIAGRTELEAQYPGLKLPPAPELSELPSASMSEQEIREAREGLRESARKYQVEVDEAIAEYQRTAETTHAMSAWVSSFKTRVARSASDMHQALLSRSARADETALSARLGRMTGEALSILDQLARDAGDAELSPQVMRCLEAVLAVQDEIEALVALQALREAVANQRQDLAELADRKRREQAQWERGRERKQRALVARQVGRVLEDLGYEVSQITDSAFTRDGHVYAVSNEWPDHALRLEFDPTEDALVARTVRVVGEEEPARIGRSGNAEDDANFVKEWCSADGLGKMRELLKRRGIHTRFEQKHASGSAPLDRIAPPKELNGLREKSNLRRQRTQAQRARKQPD